MGWFSPSHCVDYFFQSVRLVRDHQMRGGKGCNAQHWRTRCAVDFCLSLFSNSMYRVMAREGTLLVMLRSKRGTEGSFAPHFPPPSRILPMQALHLNFRATDGPVTPTPPLCCSKRAREGRSASAHPLSRFSSDRGLFMHTPPLPRSKQETKGSFCQSLSSVPIFERQRTF